ncbi:MAG: hypothetical protein V3S57_05940 [candidate division NC10 bacterium]
MKKGIGRKFYSTRNTGDEVDALSLKPFQSKVDDLRPAHGQLTEEPVEILMAISGLIINSESFQFRPDIQFVEVVHHAAEGREAALVLPCIDVTTHEQRAVEQLDDLQ